jgi:hypothetical protein
MNLLWSGMTLRRIAKVLNINFKIVQRRIDWFSPICLQRHRDHLEKNGNDYHSIQFDEMETCHITKMKPLSIPY